jgi:hypothetical protein
MIVPKNGGYQNGAHSNPAYINENDDEPQHVCVFAIIVYQIYNKT